MQGVRAASMGVLAAALCSAAAPALAQSYSIERGVSPPEARPPAVVAAPRLRARMLSWPGKTSRALSGAPSSLIVETRSAEARSMPSRFGAERFQVRPGHGAASSSFSIPVHESEASAAIRPPPPIPESQRGPQLAGAPPGARRPQSIYEPAYLSSGSPTDPISTAPRAAATGRPPSNANLEPHAGPATQLLRTAQLARPIPWDGAGGGVRFYSVHRQYGLTPNSAPIPPQFFAATPDLSDPSGPEASRSTGSAIASTTAARARALSSTAQTGATSLQP